MKPYNWLELRQLVDRLDTLRVAYGRLSDQPITNSSRIAVEESLMRIGREVDALLSKVTVDLLQRDLAKRRTHDIRQITKEIA